MQKKKKEAAERERNITQDTHPPTALLSNNLIFPYHAQNPDQASIKLAFFPESLVSLLGTLRADRA